MHEIPEFLNGIDPDMVHELEQSLDTELMQHEEEQMTRIESYRHSYIEAIARKMDAVESCVDQPSILAKFRLSTADEIARSHFLYYMDQIFTAPPAINQAMRLTEALVAADGTQARLNQLEIGQPYIYEASELHARVAEILLDDDMAKAKQDITDIYDRTIREVVLRYLNS